LIVHWLDPLLVQVLLVNFFVLGSSRLRAVVYAVAFQGVLLGLMPIFVHGEIGWWLVLLVTATIVIKGFVLPELLSYAMREVVISREIEPIVGYVPSLLLGAAGTGLALAFARTLPLAPNHSGTLVVPASLATALTGFLILTTRRKAITQAVGYLVLENGIFLFGLLLVEAMPFLVEIGVLLDLFVCVFVMGIIIHHINREFSSVSTEHLARLKD
jgi:hydrogenase-4 component E